MSTTIQSLEPFPAYVDTVDSEKINYFSKLGALHMLSPSGAVALRRKQNSIASKVINFINLCYYQWEVTLGIYMLTPMEKLVMNGIFLGMFAVLVFGVYFGLQPFLVRSICKLLYYTSGSLAGVEDICRDSGCL